MCDSGCGGRRAIKLQSCNDSAFGGEEACHHEATSPQAPSQPADAGATLQLYCYDQLIELSLQILNANHNAIHDSGLPSDLFTIRDLVTLDLSHNNLSRVPDDLSKARNVIVLSLSHNNITTIPGTVSASQSMYIPSYTGC